MTSQQPDCHDDTRRGDVRKASLNGLDYVEVSEDQRTLTVFFLGKAPESISAVNVRVEGGRRVRDIRVVSVVVHRDSRRGRDDSMDIRVDQVGDFSVYTLRVVGADGGRMQGFDARYSSLDFSFKASCPSELDCTTTNSCTPSHSPSADINYLARDYTGFRQLLLDRLAVLLPEWRERHVPDIGIALVEVLAYTGDYLSQYQDAVATEAYLDTARLRISVRRHAQLIDYHMFEGSNARAWIVLDTDTDLRALDLSRLSFATRYPGSPEGRTQLSSADLSSVKASHYEVFEPLWPPRDSKFTAYAAHSRMEFYTWGDGECCLPVGATEATLVDGWRSDGRADDPSYANPSNAGTASAPVRSSGNAPVTAAVANIPPARRLDALKVGDVLIFQEMLGPRTGNTADADATHRHAVRLTKVRRDEDALYPTSRTDKRGTPIVHIEWSADDALPFPLCISTQRAAPDCSPLNGISVARGNVLLVDHGRSTEERLPPVPTGDVIAVCDPCDDVRPAPTSPRFEPVLSFGPLTFVAPLDDSASARRMLAAPPRQSAPALHLVADAKADESDNASALWQPHGHVLNLAIGEQGFVAEIDDDGLAHLRFASKSDRRPAPGTKFLAKYRTGIGPGGNVGPETIAYLVSDDLLASGAVLNVGNPLPAIGGTAGETLTETKLRAPNAFRLRRERAITSGDYAELVERELRVDLQGAASALRWNGSWYEVQVGLDARGADEATTALQRRARAALHRYRRIGHDLRVATARLVPLTISLDVCLAPQALRAAVRAEILERVSSGRRRDGQPGLFHPDSLRYGESVTVSRLIVAAAAAEGVTSVAVTRLERLGEGPNREIENGLLPIGAMEIAQLANDPAYPERGTLTLNLRGGR